MTDPRFHSVWQYLCKLSVKTYKKMLVMDILEKLFARGESEIASSFKKRQNGFDSCDRTATRTI